MSSSHFALDTIISSYSAHIPTFQFRDEIIEWNDVTAGVITQTEKKKKFPMTHAIIAPCAAETNTHTF